MDETTRICSWCSTQIPADAAACPKCGARLDGAVAAEIPGLTVVDPKATLKPSEGLLPNAVDPLAWLQVGKGGDAADTEAVRPPSEAVRLEMRKIQLEAEIENAGTEVLNPTGNESRDAGAPSREAIDAYEAGLLDTTGPAGETDLGDLAAPWVDPEPEKRA